MNKIEDIKIGNNINLFNGDCLEVMDKLIEQGVVIDAIICDPPYGTTACKWDSVIPMNDWIELNGKKFHSYEDFVEYCYKNTKMPFNEVKLLWNTKKQSGMWDRLNKLIKPNGAIVLFGSEPFSSALRMSNIKNYKYDWVWKKNRSQGFMNAKKQPLKDNEIISVFYNKQSTYNPQEVLEINKITKNTGTKNKTSKKENGDKTSANNSIRNSQYIQTHTNYPNRIIEFKNTGNNQVHPTQKPVALMEYLVKTYTNDNETVLDFTMGSGSTGVACKNLNRNFIGIELEEKYFTIASERINKPKDTLF